MVAFANACRLFVGRKFSSDHAVGFYLRVCTYSIALSEIHLLQIWQLKERVNETQMEKRVVKNLVKKLVCPRVKEWMMDLSALAVSSDFSRPVICLFNLNLRLSGYIIRFHLYSSFWHSVCYLNFYNLFLFCLTWCCYRFHWTIDTFKGDRMCDRGWSLIISPYVF